MDMTLNKNINNLHILYKKINKKIFKNKYYETIIRNFISLYTETKKSNDLNTLNNFTNIKKKSDIKFKSYKNIQLGLKKNDKAIIIINNNSIIKKNIKNNEINIIKKNIEKNNFFKLSTLNVFNILNLIENKYIKINIKKNIEKLYIINIYKYEKDLLSINNINIEIADKIKTSIKHKHYNYSKNLFLTIDLSLNLKNNSNLTYEDYFLNKYKKNTIISTILTTQETFSSLKMINFSKKNNNKSYQNSFLVGDHSSIQKLIGCISKKNEKSININFISHYGYKTKSNILFKCLTKDKSNIYFDGNIEVNKNADKIESDLKCHGLIISKKSNISFTPKLSINNDDVICSHGATIGNINEDIITYMRTRGFSKKNCIDLIIKTFFLYLYEKNKK